jgi:hypothetical protein
MGDLVFSRIALTTLIDRFFDHYAHLGGAVFGALYYTYGMRMWDAMRVHTLKSASDKRKL